MVRIARWEVAKLRPAVVVGSSLGALVGLAVAPMGPNAPLVLIAPALGFGHRWIENLPPGDPVLFFHHGQQRQLPIHRRFFEGMTRVDLDNRPPDVPVRILMGRHDESVPYEVVRDVWERWERSGRLAPGSCFTEIPDGDHGLVEHADRIADEIRAAALLPSCDGGGIAPLDSRSGSL